MPRRLATAFVIALAAASFAGCTGSSARRQADDDGQVVGAVPNSRVPTASSTSARRQADAAALTAPAVPAGQRPAPLLPRDIAIETSETQLGVQALLAAREEVAADLAGKATVAQRHDFIFHTWLPQMRAEQARLAKLRDQRLAREQRMVQAGAAQAGRDCELQAVEDRYAVEIDRERRKTVPILKDE
ncbi:MAG: hypothetical protein H0W72_10260 [Planctomycetes bacterium]|nr:hypothetical protein [Planctomycetota bacterium]